MAGLIFFIIIMGFSNTYRRKIFIDGRRENKILIPFIFTTCIFSICSFILACCTFGSFLYFIAIINYIISVLDIRRVFKLIKANRRQNNNVTNEF